MSFKYDKNISDASWCPHSKALLPKFSAWSAEFRQANLPLVFARIDADAEPEVKPPFRIEGYPTLILVKNSNPTDFIEYPSANEKMWLHPWLQEQGIETVWANKEKQRMIECVTRASWPSIDCVVI